MSSSRSITSLPSSSSSSSSSFDFKPEGQLPPKKSGAAVQQLNLKATPSVESKRPAGDDKLLGLSAANGALGYQKWLEAVDDDSRGGAEPQPSSAPAAVPGTKLKALRDKQTRLTDMLRINDALQEAARSKGASTDDLQKVKKSLKERLDQILREVQAEMGAPAIQALLAAESDTRVDVEEPLSAPEAKVNRSSGPGSSRPLETRVNISHLRTKAPGIIERAFGDTGWAASAGFKGVEGNQNVLTRENLAEFHDALNGRSEKLAADVVRTALEVSGKDQKAVWDIVDELKVLNGERISQNLKKLKKYKYWSKPVQDFASAGAALEENKCRYRAIWKLVVAAR